MRELVHCMQLRTFLFCFWRSYWHTDVYFLDRVIRHTSFENSRMCCVSM